MNKKITVTNDNQEQLFCVVSAEQDLEEQMREVLGVTPGYGMSVDIYPDKIKLVDYFHGDTRATFSILSMEDTNDPVCLNWKREK